MTILGPETLEAIEAHKRLSVERSRLASLKRQQQEWIERQAQFQQLEIEAERTHWDADRLMRYRSMGYSIHRLAELSGDSTLVVMDVLRSMRRRAK